MIILGKDGKEYASVKECLLADAAFDKRVADEKAKLEAEKKALEEKVAEEKALVSKKKKELSDAIEKAEENYIAAYNIYDSAKADADRIIQEAQKKANDILAAAAKEVEKASKAKMNAVAEFNKEFGPYRTTLTGAKAAREYNRISSDFDRMFNKFLGGIWRL